MVKIPSAQDLGLGPSATPQSPLGPQSINVPDLSIGAQQLSGLGRAMTRMFESAAEAQIFHQKIEDERILMENESKLADLRRDALYGENGLMSRQLGDAIGATDDAGLLMPQWRDILQSEGLSEAGRDAMEQYLNREEDSILDAVASHEMRERNAYRKAMQREAAERAADEAQYYYMNPEALKDTEQAIYDAYEADLPEGASVGERAAAQAMAQGAIEEMYKGVILRAVADGADKQARVLMADLLEKDIFSEETANEMMAVVANGERETVVQYHAQAIWETTGGDLEAAMEAADALQIDGDAKKDLKAELDRRYTREENATAQQIQRIENAALNMAIEGNLDDLTREQAIFIDDEVMARLRDINAGVPTVTDNATYNRLHAMSDADLATYNLSADISSLSSEDYTAFLQRQRDAREGVNRTNRANLNGTLDNFFTFNGIDDEAKQATITRMAEDWANSQAKSQGVYPDTTAILNHLTQLNYAANGGWIFGIGGDVSAADLQLSAFENATPEAVSTYTNEIDPTQRAQVLTAMSSAGFKSVTLEQIFAAYALFERGQPITKENVEALLATR